MDPRRKFPVESMGSSNSTTGMPLRAKRSARMTPAGQLPIHNRLLFNGFRIAVF